MSGHSHFATIKRQKEAKDAQRGKIFSKMAKEIAIAVKAGGGTDPDSNYKLKIIMDRAKQVNMPKSNIERAINSGIGGKALEEVTYEGFGPSGIAVVVKVATDNRNRSAQELKNIFERAGGSLAGPGSVSFNFTNKAYFLVKYKGDKEEQMLKLIDLGVDDMEEESDGIGIYADPSKIKEIREKLETGGFEIDSVELLMKPNSFVKIEDSKEMERAVTFLDTLDDHEDVQDVFTNLFFP